MAGLFDTWEQKILDHILNDPAYTPVATHYLGPPTVARLRSHAVLDPAMARFETVVYDDGEPKEVGVEAEAALLVADEDHDEVKV